MVNPYLSPVASNVLPDPSRRPRRWKRAAVYGSMGLLLFAYMACRLFTAYEVPIQEAMEQLGEMPLRLLHKFLAWVV